jgi:hypothetical protein
MGSQGSTLSVVKGAWAAVRLGSDDPVPTWALTAPGFASITRTADELSVICSESAVPPEVVADRQWALLKLEGPIPLTKSGVFVPIAAPLSAAGISVLVISTFETDYFLVKHVHLSAACRALVSAGHDCVG